MARRLSATFGLDPASLDGADVFDRFTDIDSALHVDPHLVRRSSIPEMIAAAAALTDHFARVIKTVTRIETSGDGFWKQSKKLLTFPELRVAGLGYAGRGGGRGVGPKLASKLADTSWRLAQAGVDDPEVFELLGLFEPGFGADLLSDMTLSIAATQFAAFTSRVCAQLNIPTQTRFVRGNPHELPCITLKRKPLFLFPRSVLRDLPVALSWEDIDFVSSHNSSLRDRLNRELGQNWRAVVTAQNKRQLLGRVLGCPGAIDALLDSYKAKVSPSYNFTTDPAGEFQWADEVLRLTSLNRLFIPNPDRRSVATLAAVVRTILEQFRKLVEQNGLCHAIVDRREKISQHAFFAVADSYCAANKLDISPESNAGRGPVDFKFSVGVSRVLVEVKLSSNTKLVHGYMKQLSAYEAAESSQHSFYLVIQVGEETKTMKELEAVDSEARRAKRKCPELVYIDARPPASASKA